MQAIEAAPDEAFKAPSYRCVICSDLEWIPTDKGAKPCECLKAKLMSARLDKIPPEYRGMDMATLQPDMTRHTGQRSLIASLRSDPHISLLLSGKVGSGKSLFGWLLYKRAVEEGRPSVALSLAELLDQFRDAAMRDDYIPIVTPEELRDDKRRWFVFLDEFDKPRVTEFAAEKLLRLLDEIYNYRHQLVVASNLKKDDLRAHWSQRGSHDGGERYGSSIMRRLLELEGMARMELF